MFSGGPCEGCQLVGFSVWRNRRGSGVNVDATGAQLWTIVGGKVRRVKLYQSKADAFEAIGLRGASTD